MKNKYFSEDHALARIQRGKAKTTIKQLAGTLLTIKIIKAHNVGNDTWGAIDYLVKHHDWISMKG